MHITGNSTQHFVNTYMGKESEREYIHTHTHTHTHTHIYMYNICICVCIYICIIYISMYESESCSVVSDSLRLHGLYSPWDSLGQSAGMGSLSLLRRSSQTHGLNLSLPHYS